MGFLAYIFKINFLTILGNCITTSCILVAALTLHGDWLLLVVSIVKEFGFVPSINANQQSLDRTLTSLYLKDFTKFWISSMCIGFSIYFGFGFGFHWYYYVRQKDCPEVWKSQPKRWLSRELELDEMKTGSVCMFIANTFSALTACYIYNGGRSTMYFGWLDYGLVWWFLQFPLVFVFTDYAAYWAHRILHTPFFYNRIHKTHHKYKQPTAFSVTAFHPVEIVIFQIVLLAPLFSIPTHWAVYHTIVLYNYYHGIVTHSGVNFKAKWWQPWQPHAIFHDNHHQYYHVNFGFNMELWDKLHGTCRKPDKIYNETIFYGKGKSISEITEEERKIEILERETESVTAHHNNYNPFLICPRQIQEDVFKENCSNG